jgi:fumarate reductase flavoprotein subunit
MLNVLHHDIVIIGAGGAGLRAAIEIVSEHPQLKIALLSKVYPMRSHTVAADQRPKDLQSLRFPALFSC